MLSEDGELSGATATATPGTETQVDSGEGLGEAPAVGEAEGVAKETTAEGAETGEAATAEEGQPPAPLPEGWQDHPDTQPVFQDHYNKGRGEREKQLRQEMGRREERYGTEIESAYRQGTSAEVVSKLMETLEEGFDFDTPEGTKAVGKLLRNHASWADVFTNTRVQAAEAKMVRDVKSVVKEAGLSEEAVGQLSDIEGELVWKVRHGEVDLAGGLRELIQASFKHIKALGAQEEKERRDKLEREVTGAAGRAAERGKKPPPAAPSGAGAGGTGGGGYKTKAEARTLHVQNKISNADMRRINADPSIPEM
jgi:hypothetical protein